MELQGNYLRLILNEETVYPSFTNKLDCRKTRNHCSVVSGYKDMLLPNFLNPKDGRIVGVEV